jgi:hypothetical protein
VINVIGLVGFLRWLPITTSFERAAFWVREVFNDWLSYKARREGFSHVRPKNLYPVMNTWTFSRFAGSFIVCIAVCIGAIAIVEAAKS